MKYPFEKLEQFTKFNKYFDKTNIEIEDNNKKGIHNLRHSLATNMLDLNTSIDIIASNSEIVLKLPQTHEYVSWR